MPTVLPSQVVKVIAEFYLSKGHKDESNILPGGFGRRDEDHFTMDDLPKLSAIVELVEHIPDHLIMLEGARYANFISCLAEIRSVVTVLQHQGDNPLQINDILSGRGHPGKYTECISSLALLLSKCPDESPTPQTSELDFIQDVDIRADLRLDISMMEKAFVNGEWKGATVLAGAIVEALLLWAIQQNAPKEVQEAALRAVASGTLEKLPPSDPINWGLPHFVEVAHELKVLGVDATKQARLAQDFRNLIHPGRALRKGQKCDRSTALSAVAAVAHTVKALTPKEMNEGQKEALPGAQSQLKCISTASEPSRFFPSP